MKQERIRNRILIPAAAALLVLLVVSVANTYRLQQKHIDDEVRVGLGTLEKVFKIELDKNAELLSGLINILEHDEGLQAAWLAKNREALLAHSLAFSEEMRSKHRVTHFYFHGLDQVCFLRVHKPSRHGDYIERFTLAGAVREAKPFHGIELGPLGTFTLRAVHPWQIDGELAGYIELGIDVEGLASHLKQTLGNELFVAIEKSYLNREDWEEGIKMLGREGNWDQFEEFVVMESTMEEIPRVVAERLAEHEEKEHEKFLFAVLHDGRRYRGGFIALFDAGGRKKSARLSPWTT